MDLGLKDKVALVAAASKGLGYGIAKALAAGGAKVSLCSRSEAMKSPPPPTESRLTAAPRRWPPPVMCGAADDIQAWVDKTVAAWGAVDCLLVNAGGPPRQDDCRK